MGKKVLWIGLLVLGMVFLSVHTEAAAAETAKIGLMGSWTGPLGAMGMPSRLAGLLAIKHINQDGGFVVAGKTYKLEAVDWDDRTDVNRAVAGVNMMIDKHDIKIIVGPMMSGAVIAAQPISQPKGVNIICYSSSPKVLREGITHTFVGVSNDEMRAKFMSPFMVQGMGAKTVAFMTVNTESSIAQPGYFGKEMAALGCKTVGNEIYELGTKDFTTMLTKLKAKNPDILFLASYSEDGALITKQRMELGWPVQTVCQGNLITTNDFFVIAGDAVEGHFAQLTSLVPSVKLTPQLIQILGLDLKKRDRFNKEFVKEYGEKMRVGCVDDLYYDFVYCAVDAMKRAGTVSDGNKIREALYAIDYQGILQRWVTTPNGRFKMPGVLLRAHPGKTSANIECVGIAIAKDKTMKDWDVTYFGKPERIEDLRKKRGY